MGKSIKLKGENYWDSTGIAHNKTLLSEILNGTILYENENNNNTNQITLNDSASNYKRFLINAKSNDGDYISREIINPDGKKVNFNIHYGGGNTYYSTLKEVTYLISGNKITYSNGRELAVNINKSIISNSVARNIYITYVIGYK